MGVLENIKIWWNSLWFDESTVDVTNVKLSDWDNTDDIQSYFTIVDETWGLLGLDWEYRREYIDTEMNQIVFTKLKREGKITMDDLDIDEVVVHFNVEEVTEVTR